MTSESDPHSSFAHGGDLFERVITAIYQANVNRGDHVVDVGANHGLHTIPLARCVGWRGRVTAVEALPHLASKLKKRMRWLPQVKIINKALSCEEGTTRFTRVAKDEGLSGIRQRWLPFGMEEDIEIIEMPKTTLDCPLAAEPRRVCFIKIDVEGGEFDVVRGGFDRITRDKPLIIFENGGGHDAELYGYSRADFFALFDGLDYALFDLFGRPLTEELWDDGDRPWYVIAAANSGSAIQFVRQVLPRMIGQVEALSR